MLFKDLISNEMNKVLTLLLIFQFHFGFSYDCKSVMFDQEYEDSDIVFFGRVIDVNDLSYTIKVVENYKRDIPDTLYSLLVDGQAVPRKGSYWLIYGYGDGKEFYIAECSGSKSLDRPFGLQDFAFPLPPPISLDDNKPLLEIFKDLQTNKSLNEFYFEIATLREIVKKQEIDKLKTDLNKIRSDNTDLLNQTHNLRITLIIVLLLCVIILTLQIYRRSSN